MVVFHTYTIYIHNNIIIFHWVLPFLRLAKVFSNCISDNNVGVFCRVTEKSKDNCMDSKNLAICWWPTLLQYEFGDLNKVRLATTFYFFSAKFLYRSVVCSSVSIILTVMLFCILYVCTKVRTQLSSRLFIRATVGGNTLAH